ncbi:MerR family transcriptional regulator [Nocardioidaceae bacterium]|nr:MerR family transcriptional regulator [Nocardioidaceae bacterium]
MSEASARAARPTGMRQRVSIGEVIAELGPDFPGLTISKIRFLESEGLVEPERTSSGYRKFSRADVDRLRYVLTAQRDHYLPLKVIREHLDAMDRGLAPPPLVAGEPQVPEEARDAGAALTAPGSFTGERSRLRVSRSELLQAAAVDEDLLRELEDTKLVVPGPGGHYDSDALDVATVAGELAAYGIGPRHLRMFRTAADRDVGTIDQIVSTVRRGREPDAAARAEQATGELASLMVRFYGAVLRDKVRDLGR